MFFGKTISSTSWYSIEKIIFIFPVGKFAVFEHHGEYESLWKTWKAIYHDWLPQCEYTPRNAMPYEVYVKSKFEYTKADMLTEIYIPIE